MLSAVAIEIALLLASTKQSDPDPVSKLLEQLQQPMPPKIWTVLFVGFVVLVFVINLGGQAVGIFTWLNIQNPFQRSQPSTDQLERTRQQLRLANR